jgi:hypothetical protein
MKRFLLILSIALLIILAGLTYFRVYYTKSFSPEQEVTYEDGSLKVSIIYNRPSKKGRVIFGDNALVPYGKVWRTGANEATIFETNKPLAFGDNTLPAGKYSLWTIPNEQSWTVIFNSETGQWGVGFNAEANRKAENDVLSVDAPSVTIEKEFEQFTISIDKSGDDLELTFIWDKTLVAVPFSAQ